MEEKTRHRTMQMCHASEVLPSGTSQPSCPAWLGLSVATVGSWNKVQDGPVLGRSES